MKALLKPAIVTMLTVATSTAWAENVSDTQVSAGTSITGVVCGVALLIFLLVIPTFKKS